MKNILITGGSGFLGGRIVKHLSSLGIFNLVVASRQNNSLSNVKTYHIDWSSEKILNKLCSNIDVIIHLAAMNAKDCLNNPKEAYVINVLNTKKLLESAVKNKVKKIIYFSTAHVYNSKLEGTIDEEVEPLNSHPYAETHLLAEKIIIDYNEKKLINGVVLRLSNSFGAPVDLNANCWMLFANDLCKQAIIKNKMIIKSDGQQLRDFITIEDVCRATKFFINHEVEKDVIPVYNLGGKSVLTLYEFAKIIQFHLENFFSLKIEIESKIRNKEKLYLDYRIEKLEKRGFKLESNFKKEINELISFCINNFKSD